MTLIERRYEEYLCAHTSVTELKVGEPHQIGPPSSNPLFNSTELDHSDSGSGGRKGST